MILGISVGTVPVGFAAMSDLLKIFRLFVDLMWRCLFGIDFVRAIISLFIRRDFGDCPHWGLGTVPIRLACHQFSGAAA